MSQILNEFVENNCLYAGTGDNPYLIFKQYLNTVTDNCTINNNTKIIYKDAFKNAHINTLTFGENIKQIQEDAFKNSTINTLNYTGTGSDWCSIIFDNVFANPLQYSSAFSNTLLDNNYKIDVSSAETISAFAFYKFTQLRQVVLGYNLTFIDQGAFAGCTGLNKVRDLGFGVWGEGWLRIKFKTDTSNPLYYAKHLYTSADTEADRISLTTTEDIDHINDYAFINCESITDVATPVGGRLKYIGQRVFEGCTNLRFQQDGCGLYIGGADDHCLVLVKLDPNETQLCSKHYAVVCDEVCRSYNDNLTHYLDSHGEILAQAANNTVSLSGVKFILNKAFANLEDHTTITIPSSVVSIGRSAFENNSMLNIDLTSATNLVSIGDSCFKKCKNLQALCIPNSVLYVGSSLLLDAVNLTEFGFNANLPIPDYNKYKYA